MGNDKRGGLDEALSLNDSLASLLCVDSPEMASVGLQNDPATIISFLDLDNGVKETQTGFKQLRKCLPFCFVCSTSVRMWCLSSPWRWVGSESVWSTVCWARRRNWHPGAMNMSGRMWHRNAATHARRSHKMAIWLEVAGIQWKCVQSIQTPVL